MNNSIMMVTRGFPPDAGGVETVAWAFTEHVLSQRDEHLVILHYGQSAYSGEVHDRLIYHHLPSWSYASTFFFTCFTVPYFFLRYKPKIIINMQVNAALGAYICRKIWGVPYCIIGHGLELLKSKFKPYNTLRAYLLLNSHTVLSNSAYTDSLVGDFGVPCSQRAAIPLGADPLKFTPTGKSPQAVFGESVCEGDFICLTISRLIPRKGIDTVLKAIGPLINNGSRIKYFIAGTGPDKARLERIVKENGLVNHVFFTGYLPEHARADYYSAADLFLLPSRSTATPPDVEGFGLVFLESGACCTPSIGSSSGGIPDAIHDGVTGYLISPDDDIALAGKLSYLMEHPDKLRIMGINARELVLTNLNWEAVSVRYFKAILP